MNELTGLQLHHISLVENPVNPDCTIEVLNNGS